MAQMSPRIFEAIASEPAQVGVAFCQELTGCLASSPFEDVLALPSSGLPSGAIFVMLDMSCICCVTILPRHSQPLQGRAPRPTGLVPGTPDRLYT